MYRSTYFFFTSALVGGEWSASRPGRLNPGKEPLVPIGEEAGWRKRRKILTPPVLELRPLGRPARSAVTILTALTRRTHGVPQKPMVTGLTKKLPASAEPYSLLPSSQPPKYSNGPHFELVKCGPILSQSFSTTDVNIFASSWSRNSDCSLDIY
jgi:hypothetical protein